MNAGAWTEQFNGEVRVTENNETQTKHYIENGAQWIEEEEETKHSNRLSLRFLLKSCAFASK